MATMIIVTEEIIETMVTAAEDSSSSSRSHTEKVKPLSQLQK
jgi:hypothetical protein